jgi:hypothetical protein
LFCKGFGPIGLDQQHDDENEDKLLMDFIIDGITGNPIRLSCAYAPYTKKNIFLSVQKFE